MKYISLFLLNFFLFLSFPSISQSDILIVGTAHDVPEGKENNYEPILALVSKWDPQVICTEYIKPTDSLSYKKSYGDDYFEKQDSIAKSWNIDLSVVQEHVQVLIKTLTKKENIRQRMELRNLFYVTSDKGNARFQAHKVISLFDKLSDREKEAFSLRYPMFTKMRKYEEESSTDEFVLLEFPLAIEKGITYLHPTDDQTLRDLYHEHWEKAHEELKGTDVLASFEAFVDETKALMGEKMKDGSMLLVLNNIENQKLLYKLEYSFMPVGLNVNKDLMNYYYMDRNYKMAMHILEIAEKNPMKKIVAFYGVSHVPFIRKILRSESNHRILTLPNLEEWETVTKQLKN